MTLNHPGYSCQCLGQGTDVLRTPMRCPVDLLYASGLCSPSLHQVTCLKTQLQPLHISAGAPPKTSNIKAVHKNHPTFVPRSEFDILAMSDVNGDPDPTSGSTRKTPRNTFQP